MKDKTSEIKPKFVRQGQAIYFSRWWENRAGENSHEEFRDRAISIVVAV